MTGKCSSSSNHSELQKRNLDLEQKLEAAVAEKEAALSQLQAHLQAEDVISKKEMCQCVHSLYVQQKSSQSAVTATEKDDK